MYQRIKRTFYNEDYNSDDISDQLEDIHIDKYVGGDPSADPRDESYNNNKGISLRNKISHIFTFIFSWLRTTVVSGLSKSWFITCCLSIFTRHYLVYKLSKKTPQDYNNMIKNISEKMSQKNIFFTKIFQAFANNNNLVDKELFNHFITYTDNVKYNTQEIDYNGLYDLINIARKNGDDLIIENETPIKSGNIALVYTGILNGKNIIIKYRRKNITEKFNKSMDELELLVNVSKKMPFLCDLNINDLFEENREIMIKQLDFLNEVKNIKMFYDKFKDVETICIPKVYSYFTEDNPCAIIMDKLEGRRIENILHEDKHEYSKILSRFNLKCVFYDAIYHSDLHSGNVIFMKEFCRTSSNGNGNDSGGQLLPLMKIGILDYGIIGTMTRDEQNTFFIFFKILVSKDYNELSKFIFDSLSEKIDKSKPNISQEYKNILVNQISTVCCKVLTNDTKFFGGEEIYEINKILKTQNLQFSKFFCRVELAIAISENVCNSLATNSSYIEQMMIAFKDIFGSNVDELL